MEFFVSVVGKWTMIADVSVLFTETKYKSWS